MKVEGQTDLDSLAKEKHPSEGQVCQSVRLLTNELAVSNDINALLRYFGPSVSIVGSTSVPVDQWELRCIAIVVVGKNDAQLINRRSRFGRETFANLFDLFDFIRESVQLRKESLVILRFRS